MFEYTNESSFIEMTPLIINSFHMHKTMFIIIMPHKFIRNMEKSIRRNVTFLHYTEFTSLYASPIHSLFYILHDYRYLTNSLLLDNE